MRINRDIIRIVFVICFLSVNIIAFAQNEIVKGKIKNNTEFLVAATVSLNNQTTLTNLKGEFVFSVKPFADKCFSVLHSDGGADLGFDFN